MNSDQRESHAISAIPSDHLSTTPADDVAVQNIESKNGRTAVTYEVSWRLRGSDSWWRWGKYPTLYQAQQSRAVGEAKNSGREFRIALLPANPPRQ